MRSKNANTSPLSEKKKLFSTSFFKYNSLFFLNRLYIKLFFYSYKTVLYIIHKPFVYTNLALPISISNTMYYIERALYNFIKKHIHINTIRQFNELGEKNTRYKKWKESRGCRLDRAIIEKQKKKFFKKKRKDH